MAKPMREQMPKVSEFVDACRSVWGGALVGEMIRSAIKDGEPTFYAEEGGASIGVKEREAAFTVPADTLIQEPIGWKGKR